ncbi:MAG: glycosyltransferase family 2 protein [Bacteroidaceae bacterium]|nr:glycosyltransferase family 2 protein [Bacteroidaceae bacterium]
MMEDVKISVIVPVYNAAPYLERCVESILGQTYGRLELFLIDDGSTDGSGAICDRFLADPRVQVVHKVNGGQAQARNLGLDRATGDYVLFVDSDDQIALDTLAYCLRLQEQAPADAVLFDCLMTENREAVIPASQETLRRFSGDEILRFFMEESTRQARLYSPCLCLYRREVLGDLRFREGVFFEDVDFKYKFMARCQRIVVSNQVKYIYYITGNSTTSGRLGRRGLEVRLADQIIYELTQQSSDPVVRRLGKVKRARTAFSLLGRMARYGVKTEEINEDELIVQLTKEHRDNLFTLLFAPIGFQRKVLAILLAISFNIARRVMNSRKTIY